MDDKKMQKITIAFNVVVAIVLNSILAGIAIAIGGTAYLITGYAWLFPIGLFIVCFYNLDLFMNKLN